MIEIVVTVLLLALPLVGWLAIRSFIFNERLMSPEQRQSWSCYYMRHDPQAIRRINRNGVEAWECTHCGGWDYGEFSKKGGG